MTGKVTGIWGNHKLGDLVSFTTGKLDSNAAKPNGEYPFFTCSRETFKTDTYSFDCECVLLAGNNAAGIYPLKYFKGKFDAYQRTYVIRSKDNGHLNNRFLFYALQPKLELLKSLSTGVATKFLTLTILKDLTLSIPPPKLQAKIAAILSAYDVLFENNLRRIKILEEMAQAIYREWFVNFRFPGHEKVKMVNSPLGKIPEGWEVSELSRVSKIVDCLHSKKPSEAIIPSEQYGILLHIWNIPGDGRLDLSKKFFINEEDYRIWTKNIKVMEGDCVITNVGRVGDFAQIPRGVKAAIGRNMTAVRPIPEGVSPTFLIEYLRSPFMDKERVAKVDRGTIMDSLNVKGIIKLLIPMPPKELMEQFENLAYPLRLQAQILQEKIGNLRKTRDLLLSKLISGELDVSELDIRIEGNES